MLTFLFIFLFVGALLLVFSLWAVGLGGMAIAIYNFFRYQEMLKAKPTPMICPNCNCEDVAFQNVDSSAGSVSVGGMMRIGATKINNRHVAICKKCGHTFNYMTALDIEETKKRSFILMIVGAVVGLFGLILAVANS